MYDMMHSYVGFDGSMCVTWPILTCDMTHLCACPHDSRVPDVTHSYVWRNTFVCVTWLARMCDMTHFYACHDVFIRVTWRIWVRVVTILMCLDTFVCVIWRSLAYEMTHTGMCDTTRSFSRDVGGRDRYPDCRYPFSTFFFLWFDLYRQITVTTGPSNDTEQYVIREPCTSNAVTGAYVLGWCDFMFLSFLNSGTRFFLFFWVSTPASHVSFSRAIPMCLDTFVSVTHSYVWHIRMCDMAQSCVWNDTHWYVWHNTFLLESDRARARESESGQERDCYNVNSECMCECMCVGFRSVNNWHPDGPWLIPAENDTFVCYTFVCVICLSAILCVWDLDMWKTHSCMGHASFLWGMTHFLYVWHVSLQLMCVGFRCVKNSLLHGPCLIPVGNDTFFVCVTCLTAIDVCGI